MKLTSAARKAIPTSKFALPGRKYPIPDKSHAANARARASEFATPAEKATIFRKTAKFFGGSTLRAKVRATMKARKS